MIKKNGGIFGRNPTYNDVVVEGVLTLREAQVFDNDITINGDLTVNGTETVINTVELNVDDKNITMGAVMAKVGLTSTSNITLGQFTVLIADTAGLVPGMTVTKTAGTGAFAAGAKIASVDSHYQITLDLAHTASGSITFDTGGATDFTADGGGITLKGLTDKFIKWVKSTSAWTFSDKIEAPDVTVTNLTASLPVFTDTNKKLITQSQQNALNAIAGAVTAARFLRGDGTNVSMSAIQAADVPTLNQSTTGSAGSVKSNATTGLLQVAGPGAGTTRVMTTPDANFTAARTDAAQTFTGAQTFGNLKLDTNTLSSTDTNGKINLTPNGTGSVYQSQASGTKYHATVTTHPGYLGYGAGVELAANTNQYGDAGAMIRARCYGNVNESKIGLTMFAQEGSSATPVARIHMINGGTLQPEVDNAQDLGNPSFYDGATTVNKRWRDLYLAGNVVIGTSGKGIDFSATPGTGTSELLADYEEGDWTPTLTTSGTGFTSVSYFPGAVTGKYTKVGNVVTVQGSMRTTAITVGSASGNLRIGGLPFTAANVAFSDSCANVNSVSSFATNQPSTGRVVGNSTQIELEYRTAANGATTAMGFAEANTGYNVNIINFSATYRV